MNVSDFEEDITDIPVNTKRIVNHNILSVSVGTTATVPDNAGHGGRTLLSIKNEYSTCMAVRVTCHGEQPVVFGDATDGLTGLESVDFLLGGHAEAETFAEALEFAASTIREALKKPGDTQQ